MSQIDTIRGAPRLIRKGTISKSISRMNSGKAARLLGLVSEMVRAAGETGIDMIIDLVNHFIVRVIPREWELSVTVNC